MCRDRPSGLAGAITTRMTRETRAGPSTFAFHEPLPVRMARSPAAGYPRFMLLGELVDVSRRIAATSSRLEKIALVASALRGLNSREIGIGAAFLSGYPT